VCEINDPGHTCDEYLVLLTKLAMEWMLRPNDDEWLWCYSGSHRGRDLASKEGC
jgi:hypothetical protein